MRLKRHAVASLAASLAVLAVVRPAALGAQQTAPPPATSPPASTAARDSAAAAARLAPLRAPIRPFGALAPRSLRWHDTLPALSVSPALRPFGSLAARESAAAIAAAQRSALEANFQARFSSLWGEVVAAGPPVVLPDRAPPVGVGPAGTPPPLSTGAVGAAPVTKDTTQNFASGLFSQYADLGIQLNARLETKAESNRNDRCSATEQFAVASTCKGAFQPQFDFQFNLRSGGVVADRVHMNVDYDSQREFDASNNISVYYEGKQDELLQRLEVGNVSFQPTPSRFITGGIPSGNYGVQAVGQVGPMRFHTIMAQQKGNVVKDRVFSVGDHTERAVDSPVEDYQFQGRQFFFTVDPRQFTGLYPYVDILNRQQMDAAAALLPANVRPAGVNLYRWRRGSPPVNPNGPRFRVRGAASDQRNSNAYEYLRPGIDYYIDPSNLWIALVRPVEENEQLVVAYRAADGSVGPAAAGGTPDIEYNNDSKVEQVANLLWEKELTPADSAYFSREIRSVYRVGGDDVQRPTVAVKVAIGASGDQEKPESGAAQTYLKLFGLAQVTNATTFDVDNRLWPRVGDPNISQAGVTGGRLIRDYFLVFPTLKPFSSENLRHVAGGAGQPDPANDSLYTALSLDFRTQRRPTSIYHLRMRFNAVGGSEAGNLSLGSVQVRQNSERLAINGVALKRDVDYTVEYETGQVTFLHPDTLFRTPQQVQAQYEENPVFAGAAPTTLFGFASTFPMTNGQLNFTAISQSQKTAFNRPPLGSEPASSLVAGVSGEFAFDADRLSLALKRLPFGDRVGESQVAVSGEFATSRPQPNAAGQAYVESFEGEGGTDVALGSTAWTLSSRPRPSLIAGSPLNATLFDTSRAAAIAWQSVGRITLHDSTFTPAFTAKTIDTTVVTSGGSYDPTEPVLFMTLYPLSVGGLTNNDGATEAARRPQWVTGASPARHWRSIRTILGASGTDLTRAETFEFWALIDTTGARRAKNPTLVFDFGEVSENTLAFEPTKLCVHCASDPRTPAGTDSLYFGRRPAGLDTLDSERDPLTRGFDQARDDVGLPGDLVRTLPVVDGSINGPPLPARTNVPICSGGDRLVRHLGDTRTNCTVQNNRLDEDDIDLDGQLNYASPDNEGVLRYVVDLSDTSIVDRYGACFDTTRAAAGDFGGRDLCAGGSGSVWTHYRISFRAPTDSLGTPNRRLIRALRMTLVSGVGADDSTTTIAVARMRLVGAPWVKRGDRPIAGIAGTFQPGNARTAVIASLISTGEASGSTHYQSPPGVTDEAADKTTGVGGGGTIQVNERSMRVQAVGLDSGQRAEAYFKFDGVRNFMGYREMRVWARGVGNGWGPDGNLQFFVKAGRDENNFYLYRRPVAAGQGQGAWTDATVDLERFYDLRAQLQNVYLRNGDRDQSCTDPADRLLIEKSRTDAGLALSLTGAGANVYAACFTAEDGGHYMALTANPNVSPPNLSAVQDLSVGIVRVSATPGLGAPLSGDTLELWVDDIRLTRVVNTPGYAGQMGLTVNAGDIANVRMNVSRRDPNFRQLGEQPTFITDNAFDVSASLSLEKLLPQRLGLAIPLVVTHSRSASDPFFLSQSDVRGGGIEGLRTPQASSTNYQLSVQKITPTTNRWLGPVVNNLALNGSLTTGSARSEFSDGSSQALALNAAYSLSSPARTARLPAVLDRAIMHLPAWLSDAAPLRALRRSEFRLNPTSLRFTSGLARVSDERAAFTKPVSGTTDTARFARSLQNVWRNAGALELRPVSSLAMRWDVTSTRDLRQYTDSSALRVGQDGNTTDFAPVLRGERQRLLGLDVGLETARNMTASISWSPAISTWLQPRADLGSTYSMTRNPNAPSLVRDSSSGRDVLPRDLQNSQVFTLGSVIDVGRAIVSRGRAGTFRRGLSATLQPFNVSYSRTVTSVFANSPLTPGLGYQFATGGLGNFLSLGNVAATNAVLSNQISANQSLNLPLGLNAVSRFQRNSSRTYTLRVDESQGINEVSQLNWPNVSLRWSFRPPSLLRGIVASVGANAGIEATRQQSVSSGATAESPLERSNDVQRRYPLNGSVTWAHFGVSTSASYTTSERTYARPGAHATQRSSDISLDLGKAFALPASWKAQDKLNTHIAYQASRTQNFDFSASAQASSTDVAAVRRVTAATNRNSINFNADTRLSSSMIGTLNFTRVINADLYRGSRYTQTLVSAVLQLQFFAGELH